MRNFETLKALLVELLQEAFDAESQLAEALPLMSAAARTEELRTALDDHNKETSSQLVRLREVFGMLDIKSERKTCRVMTALIREAAEIGEATGDPRVIDAALIAAAQRMKHYMVASYGSAKAFAICEDEDTIAGLLDDSADEAREANKLLTKIAVGSIFRKSVNKEAAKAKEPTEGRVPRPTE